LNKVAILKYGGYARYLNLTLTCYLNMAGMRVV